MKRPCSATLLPLALGCADAGAHDAPAPAEAHAHASAPATTPSPSTIPLDALDCEGVSLAAPLRAAGARPDGKPPGDRLAHDVPVGARDGYRVLHASAEPDPATGHRVPLADRCDGKPLDDQGGPLRLIAPEDARPARWVRQVEAIAVAAAP